MRSVRSLHAAGVRRGSGRAAGSVKAERSGPDHRHRQAALQGIDELNAEGRERLLAAFDVINEHFQALFQALFNGGQAELRLVEDGRPRWKPALRSTPSARQARRMASMSLMSGGERP